MAQNSAAPAKIKLGMRYFIRKHKESNGGYYICIVTLSLKGPTFLCALRIEHAAFFYSPVPSEIEEGVTP